MGGNVFREAVSLRSLQCRWRYQPLHWERRPFRGRSGAQLEVVEHVRGHRPRVEVRVKIVHLAVRRQLQLAFVVAPAPKYNQSQPKKQPKTNRNTHQPGALPSVADIPSPTTSLPLAMRSVPITAPPPMRGASSVHVMFRLALLRSGTGSGAGGAGCTAGGDVVMPA